ncbi:glucoamylase family protein [Flavitalea flava]
MQKQSTEPSPFRAELFSSGQIEGYGKTVAGKHRVGSGCKAAGLFRRLSGNESVLTAIHDQFATAAKVNRRTGAIEWFLNNFPLIKDQIHKARKGQPKKIPENFWHLTDGPSNGLPRIYAIAVEIISHSDGQLDPESLKGFILSYQTLSVLSQNELSAFPTFLRLALIENLRRIAVSMSESIAANRVDHQQMINWLSLRNNITSLRILTAMDWHDFIDDTSVIEPILRRDIGGIYPKMDYFTRNDYRNAVEKMAWNSGRSCKEVAQAAIQLAKENAERYNREDNRTAHVGFYLIDSGRPILEKLMNVRRSRKELLEKKVRDYPLLVYAGSISVLTFIIGVTLFMGGYSRFAGSYPAGTGAERIWLFLAGLFSLACAGQAAITVTDLLTKFLIIPRRLPRMDFSTGIPPEFCTLVIVPALLRDKKELEKLVYDLEVRFLANQDDNLHFGLLTDFQDASDKTVPGDDLLLQLAKKKIEDLNRKYGRPSNSLFFLFHRPRHWNATEHTWMGYERKRGKLMELNVLLRTNAKEGFSLIIGNPEIFPKIKYVITLDADTRLTGNAAWKLIGTLAHPLNRAVYCEKKQRVTEGYGIIQPRIGVYFKEEKSTFYAHMHENDSGIDPYTLAGADVYQDLFNEGSFIGKGIYDVDIFLKVLRGRWPENRILSHDLLEGCYIRSGLLSDTRLYEAYPDNYRTDVRRRVRWIRGDWQIGFWILPFVPGPGKRLVKNPISALSKWKIFDNLRRSLMPPAFFLLLVWSWIVPGQSMFYSISVIFLMALPWLTVPIQGSSKSFSQMVHRIACLPHEAFYSGYAILLSAWRMLVSRKKLLEWHYPGHNGEFPLGMAGSNYGFMWAGPLVSLILLLFLNVNSSGSVAWAGPFLFLWLFSPVMTWFISKPRSMDENKLSEKQNLFLRRLTRKTWTFFENFVSPFENWLPPDHFQEYPVEKVAHYTSPTNIGLALLANLTAWDFGYLTTGEFIERTSGTMNTMRRLERYHGHFYNWYDTLSLKAAAPKYVSTVDSGNLAGHLLTLRQAILAMPEQKITGPGLFQGLSDTLSLVEEELSGSVEDWKEGIPFENFKKELTEARAVQTPGLSTMLLYADRLFILSGKILDSLPGSTGNRPFSFTKALHRQCGNIRADLLLQAPWLQLSSFPQKFGELLPADEIPSVQGLLKIVTELIPLIENRQDHHHTMAEQEWLQHLKECLLRAQHIAQARMEALDELVLACNGFTDQEYEFLYDRSMHLLAIGYNVETHRRDAGYYDLLASEARLASFVGIAQGKLPLENWIALGRTFGKAGNKPILFSWSGTMFEYLMPLLVMPMYEKTLLDQTCKAVVKKQIGYGRERGIPWGISECCYSVVDSDLNYQYRACGIQEISLRPRLEDDLVVAPYASALALMIEPKQACRNLVKLAAGGAEGQFGLFEAIDHSLPDLPKQGGPQVSGGKKGVTVGSYMVHHQGMIFLSMAYFLLHKPMQKRFEADPQLQGFLLLLQEQVPKEIDYYLPDAIPAAIPAEPSSPEETAATYLHPVLKRIGVSSDEERCFSSLARVLLFSQEEGKGKLPVVLLRIKDPTHISLVEELVRMHAYWRLHGLTADLVIWNDVLVGYRTFLQDHIRELISSGVAGTLLGLPGGVYILTTDQLSPEDQASLQTKAQMVIPDEMCGVADLVKILNKKRYVKDIK